jgi:hypothetical protein
MKSGALEHCSEKVKMQGTVQQLTPAVFCTDTICVYPVNLSNIFNFGRVFSMDIRNMCLKLVKCQLLFLFGILGIKLFMLSTENTGRK